MTRYLLITTLSLGAITAACTGGGGKAALPPSTAAAPTPELAKPAAVPSPVAPAPELSKPEAAASTAEPAPKAVAQKIWGQVTPRERSAVGFKVAGFISKAAVRAGQTVKKGEVLGQLDSSDFELNLRLAEARRRQAEVTKKAAERERQRELGLKEANATTDTALDRVQTAYDQAEVTGQLATLEVSKARRALDDTTLRAPYDCIVAKELKFSGEYAGVGIPVIEIAENAAPEIVLNVPERYVGSIAVGRELTIVIPSTNYKGTAKVVRVVGLVSDKTRTFEVVAEPGEMTTALTAGLFVEAEVN